MRPPVKGSLSTLLSEITCIYSYVQQGAVFPFLTTHWYIPMPNMALSDTALRREELNSCIFVFVKSMKCFYNAFNLFLFYSNKLCFMRTMFLKGPVCWTDGCFSTVSDQSHKVSLLLQTLSIYFCCCFSETFYGLLL